MPERKPSSAPIGIRSFRLENRLTQSEMAAFLGVSQKTISRWELGVDHPTADVYEKLRSALADCGEDHWAAVYRAVRQAAIPIALVDDQGKVLVASELYATSTQAAAPAGASAGTGGAPLPTILVIEDDRAILKATGAVLKRWQFLSIGIADGAEAARMVAEGAVRPDAAIIDFLLPGNVDGVDVAAQLRQSLPDLPILMITGEATPPRLRKIADSGLPLIQKPVDPRQLRAALLSMLPRVRA